MRKRRAMIFDDDSSITYFLKYMFTSRGYDVMAFTEPLVCPIDQKNEQSCTRQSPCADVLITDFHMPRMNGLELLRAQADRGCKLPSRNKAVLSGNLNNDDILAVKNLNCAFFDKSIELSVLEGWIAECEQRIDLAQPLAALRKEERAPASQDSRYQVNCIGGAVECSALNVSPNGFCLKLPVLLECEQIVQVASLNPGITRNAAVRWTSGQKDGAYLAGLSCC